MSVGNRKRPWSKKSGPEEEDDWYEKNVARHQSDEDEEDWHEKNVAGYQAEEERGRPRRRQQ